MTFIYPLAAATCKAVAPVFGCLISSIVLSFNHLLASSSILSSSSQRAASASMPGEKQKDRFVREITFKNYKLPSNKILQNMYTLIDTSIHKIKAVKKNFMGQSGQVYYC